jgi:hypothetical protein
MVFKGKCPLCGTGGRRWSEPGTFQCPNCSSIFSDFGVILETRKEEEEGNTWS